MAALGVFFIAPVVTRQASLCKLLSSVLLTSDMCDPWSPDHGVVGNYGSDHHGIDPMHHPGFGPQVLPDVLLQVQKAQ